MKTVRHASMRRSERGVAIITALVVVAAATVAIAGMMWRQSVAVRKLENQNAIDQSRWLGRSALEWARLILMQDARTSVVDHYGELWAVPLAETRVSGNGSATESAGASADSGTSAGLDVDAFVSGRIRDAQARFNLTNLVGSDGVNKQAFATLERLIDVVGQPQAIAKVLTARMLRGPRPIGYDALAAELVHDGKLDPAAADALSRYLVVLPKPTPINFNTAAPEVISASFEDLPLDQARALAVSRDRVYFNQASDVVVRLSAIAIGGKGSGASPEIAVATHYFEVHGLVRHGRAEYSLDALIERDNAGLTRVVRLNES